MEEIDYSYDIKVPKDRIAVVIGKKGEVKREIEDDLGITITVDSKDGTVSLSGHDSMQIFIAKDIVRAIARGFNPDIARSLIKQDYNLQIIDLTDFVGKSKKDASRLKARVIGTDGKARRKIEELTESNICVYGKTISVVGEIEAVMLAKRAIERLLAGSPHVNVFRWLEKKYKEKRHAEALEALGVR